MLDVVPKDYKEIMIKRIDEHKEGNEIKIEL